MENEVLRFENVWYLNTESSVHVDDINFTLAQGEGLLISGPEGSGKSVILELIMGKRIPKVGQIWLDGNQIENTSDEDLEKLRFSLGYVSQSAGLINNLSVVENILFPLRYHTTMDETELNIVANSWIERYELTHKRNTRPVALTASEMIRTALIRALIVNPRVLLIDTAFDSLCPLASRRIIELLSEDIKAYNLTYIISTYNTRIFRAENLQFKLIYRGKIVFSSQHAEIYSSEDPALVQYLRANTTGPMQAFNDQV